MNIYCEYSLSNKGIYSIYAFNKDRKLITKVYLYDLNNEEQKKLNPMSNSIYKYYYISYHIPTFRGEYKENLPIEDIMKDIEVKLKMKFKSENM